MLKYYITVPKTAFRPEKGPKGFASKLLASRKKGLQNQMNIYPSQNKLYDHLKPCLLQSIFFHGMINIPHVDYKGMCKIMVTEISLSHMPSSAWIGKNEIWFQCFYLY